jgi:hypothetical protein
MSAANPSDLIISLSHDKVTLNLIELPEKHRSQVKATFGVDSIFLEEQMAKSMDQVLTDHPSLIDQFSCVDIIVMDRPNVNIPRFYTQNATAAEIASRYLRVRKGDTLATDDSGHDSVFCYTMPIGTLQMLKEYYSNVRLTHLSSLVWNTLSGYQQNLQNETLTYYIVLENILVVLASKNGKLIFSKNVRISDEADLFYYTIACGRMLKSTLHWLVSIENEDFSYEMPGESILKIDQHLMLPALHILMAQYKECVS